MDDLTLKPSLRAAETCDLAKHRCVRLQGEASVPDKMGNGSITEWQIPAFPDALALVPRPTSRPARPSSRALSSAAPSESGSA